MVFSDGTHDEIIMESVKSGKDNFISIIEDKL